MRVTLARLPPSGLLTSALAAALCLALGAGAAPAQERGGGGPRALKVDEFGRLYGCSGGARLDNFAIELEKDPGAKGYIVARDAGDKLRGAAHAWGAYFVKYFSEFRGMDESRFVLVDGADAGGDDLLMELWVVPGGAEPPPVKPPGKKEARPFAGRYAALSVFDDKAFYDVEGSSAGSFGDGILYAAFARVLMKQPDSQGYLVVYSPPGAAPGYWRRAGTREQQKISRDGVGPERLTVIHGGALPVREKPKEKPRVKAAGGADAEDENPEDEAVYGGVELWVGAKDSPPVKHVEEDSALTEALLVGANYFYEEESDVAGWMLNNLADMMRADRRSVGCVVVYPGDGSGLPAGDGAAHRPAPDVLKIAEGWKAELLKKHGFDPSRVVVLSGPREDSGTGRLEVWAVPHGAALPDPFAQSLEPAGEEEGEGEGTGRGEGGGDGQQPPPPVREED